MDKLRPYIAWDVVQDFIVKAFTELRFLSLMLRFALKF